MELWEYILLFSCVMIGGSIALYYKEYQHTYLNQMLTFSGAYIIGIAILHLMPIAFHNAGHTVGIAMLAGFFVQLLLEQLSGGVEHGHIHIDDHDHGNSAYLGQVILGLCLHAFIEGLPLGGSYEELDFLHVHGESHLLYGIILHKVPAAFALAALMINSGFKNRKIIIYLIFFASMSPLGAGLSEYLAHSGWLNETKYQYIMAFVVGSFLHIATTILFETEKSGHHKLPLAKVGMIAVGLFFAILTTFV